MRSTPESKLVSSKREMMCADRARQGGFGADRLLRVSQMERDHFWFVARREWIAKLAARHSAPSDRRWLDLGCGSGLMLESLSGPHRSIVGLDLRCEGLLGVLARNPKACVSRGQAEHLPFASDCFDMVLALDLLEHTDDRAVLKEVRRILRPSGRAIISVPAFSGLWSYRDEAAGHLRRYTPGALRSVVGCAGLEMEDMRYYQFLLFPLTVISRLLGRRRRSMRDLEDVPPAFLNRLLTGINRIDVRLGERLRWPWGSSLVAVAKKDIG
jgi:ubiquinone/menaquinone biosynthesis C-methylase UbiE